MSLSKRLDKARQAYEKGNLQESAAAHDEHAILAHAHAPEKHGGVTSQYLGDFVYGGLDGIITTFAVVSGVAGADLGSRVVLILGLANLFADGFSMGTGAFLSTRSEGEYYRRERSREEWEVDHFPDGERAELVAVYRSQGYSEEEAVDLVEIQTRNKKRWVDVMMVHELGLLPEEKRPILSGLTTLFAFVLAGSVPLLIFLLVPGSRADSFQSFLASSVPSGLALFALGAAKVLVTRGNWLRSGLEMLVIGGLAGGVAYVVGHLLKSI